jgi:hypothetical protein
MSKSLFELSEELLAVAKQLEDLDDPKAVKDTLEEYKAPVAEKIKSMAILYKSLEGEIDVFKQHKASVDARIKLKEKASGRLKNYILESVIKTGVTIDCPEVQVKTRSKAPRLGAVTANIEDLPADCIKRQAPSIDARALLARAKQDPIKGVEVIRGEKSVTIK